jgi:sRNA-binding carbon storage regulator CsrA
MAGLSLKVKKGEAVLVGDDIRVELFDVRGTSASIRFIAPRDVRVLRESILTKEAGSVAGSGPVSVSDSTAG